MKSKLGKKLHTSILACLGLFFGLFILLNPPPASAAAQCFISSWECNNAYSFSCQFQNKTYCCTTNDECVILKGGLPANYTGPTNTNVGIHNPVPWTPPACQSGSITTALGCIPYQFQPFTTAALGWLVGIAGALSMSIMIYAAILRAFAGDNQEVLKKANEQFTAGALGLLFIVFSVSILSIIAGRLLLIPGF